MSCAGVCSAARTAPSSSAFTRTLTLRQPNCYENGSDLITRASLVSVSGIFIFNWLRWSFRPRSALYFRWHLTALTDISFVFFFFIHETSRDRPIGDSYQNTHAFAGESLAVLPLCNLWNGSTEEEWQPFRRDLFWGESATSGWGARGGESGNAG